MNETKRTRRPTGTRRNPEPRLRLRVARFALAWERLWPALWPAVGIAGTFLALALFGIPPLLGGWAHAALLAVFAIALAAALAMGLRRFRMPDEQAALRRLEHDNGLSHRPLGTLRDELAGTSGDPATAALWRLHRERMRSQLRNLRVRAPHPRLLTRDPLALRALVGLLLFVAAVGAWGDWRPRLAAALSPDLAGGGMHRVASLDIWLTPPEYTGLPPVFLRPPGTNGTPAEGGAGGAGEEASAEAVPGPVQVPVGSTVLARITGGEHPVLVANDTRQDFEPVDGASYQAGARITGGTEIAVEQDGRSLGAWPIEVVPDLAPTIELDESAEAGERGALRIGYSALDDYGIVDVAAVIRLETGDMENGIRNGEQGIGRPPIALKLPLAKLRPTQVENTSFHDLTPHPWAGLPVTLRLSATDGAGQTGTTGDVRIVLPERRFSHPVARAIVEQRRQLTLRPRTGREDVARALGMLSARPGRYHEDIVVFLGLRTAMSRLYLDRTEQAVPAVQDLLWELALRVEDGELSIAERALRDAQQALMDALDREAEDEELQRLMDELQTAMDQFLDAMEEQIRQALERGEQPPQIPPMTDARVMDRQDLQEMMDQMRRMAETGARDAAREMLSQLQQMMENMRAGTMAQMQQGQSQAGEMMRELQELTQRQQELLDQSFRESQGRMQGMQNQMPGMQGQSPNRQGRPGGNDGQPGQMGQGGRQPDDAAAQEALRRQLGDLMRRFGETMGDIPGPLGRAERAMRNAENALGQGQPGMAVPPQTTAVDELQQGLQSMAEQMAQQMMGQQPGGQQPFQRQGQGRDPLGRQLPGFGWGNSESVRIPEEADLQRAREILDELRRRAGEFSRPQLELDYIDRLLRQF